MGVMEGAGGIEDETSRLQIQIPRDLFKPDGYNHKEALFGIPVYGGFIAEKLYYANTTKMCSAPTADEVAQWKSPYILMVDRGDCTFVTKVRHAQHAGASGVLVADNLCVCKDLACHPDPDTSCQGIEPIMADDGSGADITIPSFLLYKPDADAIKEKLRQESLVQVEMTWSLPTPDDRVEWSLWTSANDSSSAALKEEFKEAMAALGQHQYFTPYYQVYDGAAYNCVNFPDHCGSLCTNHGRYCMPDPDKDPYHGYSGRDIVIENLRQKCIWNHYGGENTGKEEGVGLPWWGYVREFTEKCSRSSRFTDPNCIKEAMGAAGVDHKKIEACMEDAGGVDQDRENLILQAELLEKLKKSIVIVPSVYVNNVVQRGGISSVTVLSSICAGYLEGTQPKVCNCVGVAPDQVMTCVQGGDYRPVSQKMGGSGGGVSWGGVLGIVTLVILGMTAAGFVYWKRTQEQMREQVRSILAEYMPLEDAPGDSNPSTTAGGGSVDSFSGSRANSRYYDLQPMKATGGSGSNGDTAAV
ncbi:hypothetical protein NSK_001313 [Nannochloropsis salina CCMP1776]|uniref:Uncharacterized protein n=1 Tax=Nannochloropsis salina CCMP1776 TaxID=1027361 RepID=A0A4D9DEA6_9STRA|nr:hypothetical protein NSK_001313 [Nannochloropsis salina CCMP1776]|eukprot:TFJ86979.1 hypothetical protein NSK_001313 [Nannochloropsis salina CCMP1776]